MAKTHNNNQIADLAVLLPALVNQRVLEPNLKPVLVVNNPQALVASNLLDSESILKIISEEAA